MPPNSSQPPASRTRLIAKLAAAFAAGWLVGVSYKPMLGLDKGPTPSSYLASYKYLMGLPGQFATNLSRANEVELADSESVLGIVVNGQPRAYVAAALSAPDRHIAYDTIQGTSLALTYCDMSGCVRAFSGPADQTEGVQLGGWISNEMHLVIDGDQFRHSDPAIPLTDYPVTNVLWGQWKSLHPDTTVYLGDYEPGKEETIPDLAAPIDLDSTLPQER
jgi:hypothetical protein